MAIGKRSAPCCVPGCSRLARSKGYCGLHIQRLRRGNLDRTTTDNRDLSCSVSGCWKAAICKGYCLQHYRSIKYHGRKYLINRPAGAGSLDRGYQVFTTNYEKTRAHRMIAERALGKPLPKDAVVHHMNSDILDNETPLNLVICPNQSYHMLLHSRMKAHERLRQQVSEVVSGSGLA